MVSLTDFLEQDRCPHCGVNRPTLRTTGHQWETQNHKGENKRYWRTYICGNCGGMVTAGARFFAGRVLEASKVYPSQQTVDKTIPEPTHRFLSQALNSLSSPDGAVMLAASAVDAMLKERGLKQDSLYARIKEAREKSIINSDMEKWAHQVRPYANEPRHADEKNPHHDEESAKRAVDFALALAQFLFVLPARVTKGIEDATKATPPQST